VQKYHGKNKNNHRREASAAPGLNHRHFVAVKGEGSATRKWVHVQSKVLALMAEPVRAFENSTMLADAFAIDEHPLPSRPVAVNLQYHPLQVYACAFHGTSKVDCSIQIKA
jgi:hypothetical protein